MDFEAEFSYPANEKVVKIAVFSKGDNISDCNAVIKKYLTNNDVFIISFSIKVRGLVIPAGATVVRIQKTVASSKISEVQANANDGYNIICNI